MPVFLDICAIRYRRKIQRLDLTCVEAESNNRSSILFFLVPSCPPPPPPLLHFTVLKSFQPKNTGWRKRNSIKRNLKRKNEAYFEKERKRETEEKRRKRKKKKILEEEEKEKEEFSFTTKRKGVASRGEKTLDSISRSSNESLSLSLLTSTSTLLPPPPFSPSSFSSAFDSPPFLLLLLLLFLLPSSPSPVFFSFLLFSFFLARVFCQEPSWAEASRTALKQKRSDVKCDYERAARAAPERGCCAGG